MVKRHEVLFDQDCVRQDAVATATRSENKQSNEGDRMHRRHFMAGTAALAASVHSFPVRAQDYPARNVRVVIPYAPGGGTDFVGRVVTEQMAALARQGFVVETVRTW